MGTKTRKTYHNVHMEDTDTTGFNPEKKKLVLEWQTWEVKQSNAIAKKKCRRRSKR